MFDKIFSLVKADIRRIKNTPLIYFLVSGYLLVSGFFFFSLVKSFNPFQRVMREDDIAALNFNTGVIQPLFEAQSVVLLFIIPFITMRSIAEEKQNGTLQLLLTTSISTPELVISKFVSTFLPLLLLLSLGLLFPITIYFVADPELGPIITGFLGLILLTSAFCSLGLFLSMNSPNQTIAGIFSLIVGMLWLLMDLPLLSIDSPAALYVRDLSLAPRLQGFFKGVVSSLDLIFFLGATFLFLTLCSQSLSIQREE